MKSLCSAVAVLALVLMVACGGGGGGTTPELPVSAPLFTSTPVTSANEGSAYAYKLVATTADGSSVSFALTSAPTGATLSGDTIAWTPTAAQSRVKNDFIVTATRSRSTASETQSWSVTPSGTVHLSSDITLWSPSGSKVIHIDYTATDPLGNPYALVPQADGSYRKLTGTGTADGKFTIPNVPAGYFWLVQRGSDNYWTSSSDIDLGFDGVPLAGTPGSPQSTSTTFNFNFDFNGLDPIQAGGKLVVVPDSSVFGINNLLDTTFQDSSSGVFPFKQGTYEIGGTTYQGTSTKSSILDYSKTGSAFVAQYNPVLLGDVTAFVLGPSLQITNPSWTNGGTNTVSGTLAAGQRNSFDLTVKGTAWQALLAGVSPTETRFTGSTASIMVQPNMPQSVSSFYAGLDAIPLFGPQSPFGLSINCTQPGYGISSGGWSSVFYTQPAITTDKDFGSIRYSDPFPSGWSRTFSFCQGAGISIPIEGTDSQVNLNLGYGLDTATPANPVTPLVGPVQNVTIAGKNLFAPTTISTATPTLSWSAPAVGVPYGYRITVIDVTPPPPQNSDTVTTAPWPVSVYETSRTPTSVRLTPGHMYVFQIVAMTDGRANVETRPNRSALPRGNATSISAPITVDSAAAPVVIQ
jgi:hypothetical protein